MKTHEAVHQQFERELKIGHLSSVSVVRSCAIIAAIGDRTSAARDALLGAFPSACKRWFGDEGSLTYEGYDQQPASGRLELARRDGAHDAADDALPAGFAFDIIADPATDLSDAVKTALVLKLARAAGPGGMAGGQALDLDAARERPGEDGIIRLQAMKTGALIRFACEAGAIAANAPMADRERLAAFGSAIGLAFQLADDLLDVEASPEVTGKATGKDAAAGKATLVGLFGVEKTRKELNVLLGQAEELLAPFGEKARMLSEIADYVARRDR